MLAAQHFGILLEVGTGCIFGVVRMYLEVLLGFAKPLTAQHTGILLGVCSGCSPGVAFMHSGVLLGFGMLLTAQHTGVAAQVSKDPCLDSMHC